MNPPRKVPWAVKESFKKELDRLVNLGVLLKVSEPTAWVSNCVRVVKPNKVRICIDPSDLNKALKRNHYPMPTIDDVANKLKGAKFFSKFDVKDGFLHMELDEESSQLTCFNSCFGRFRWTRCPFGVSVVPEEYQRRQDELLEGLDGEFAVMDDTIIAGFGETDEEAEKDHDAKVVSFLNRCRESGIRLRRDKVVFKKRPGNFVGHEVTANGLKPDTSKLRSLREVPAPTDKAGVRRLLGFVNYLGKFTPNLSSIMAPVRELLKYNVEFRWEAEQESAFQKVKELLCKNVSLAHFDQTKSLTLQVDAAQHGLGCAVLQEGLVIGYASRSLTHAESRYSQIEKELLAVVFGLEKFHHFTYGRLVHVESDHKPLQSILQRALHEVTARSSAWFSDSGITTMN